MSEEDFEVILTQEDYYSLKSELAKKEDLNANLQRQLIQAAANIQVMHGEIQSLKSLLTQRRQSILTLSKSLLSLSSSYLCVDSSADELQQAYLSEKHSLLSRIKDITNSKLRLEQNYQKLLEDQKEISEKEKEAVAALRIEVAQLRKSLKAITAQNNEQQSIITTHLQTIAGLTADNNALTEREFELEKKFLTLGKSLQVHESAITQSKGEINRLTSINQQLAEELMNVKKSNEELRDELQSKTELFASTDLRNKALQQSISQVAEVSREIEDYRIEHERLNEESSRLKKRNVQLISEKKELTLAAEKQAQEIVLMREEFDQIRIKMVEDFACKETKFNFQTATLKEEYSLCKIERERVTKELNALKAARINNSNEDLHLIMLTLKQDIERVNKQYKLAVAENSRLVEAVKKSHAELKQREQNLKSLQFEYDAILTQMHLANSKSSLESMIRSRLRDKIQEIKLKTKSVGDRQIYLDLEYQSICQQLNDFVKREKKEHQAMINDL